MRKFKFVFQGELRIANCLIGWFQILIGTLIGNHGVQSYHMDHYPLLSLFVFISSLLFYNLFAFLPNLTTKHDFLNWKLEPSKLSRFCFWPFMWVRNSTFLNRGLWMEKLDKYFRKSFYSFIWQCGNYINSLSQCGNFGNFPPLQKCFVKLIYSITPQCGKVL